MSANLRPMINTLHVRVHDPVDEIPDLYDRTSQLAELVAAVMVLAGKVEQEAGRLPGRSEGLRLDDLGELLSPDEVRDGARDAIRDAVVRLNEAGQALSGAVQQVSRLYLQSGSIADQLRPDTE